MFGFSDLEDRLNGPEAASELHATLTALSKIRAEIEAANAQGLAPEDHTSAQKILEAVQVSELILTTVRKANGVM